MSYLPISGQPSLFWEGGSTKEFVGFPALELGVLERTYLIAEYLAGNETVVALASGDVNWHIKEYRKPQWALLLIVSTSLMALQMGLCVYIRKLMYDQAPKNKKWERSLASTCIEIEFIVALSKFPYALTFGHGLHIWPLSGPIVMFFSIVHNEGSNATSALMIVYWLGITNSKSMSKKQKFVSGSSVIAIAIIQFPFFLFTFLSRIGYMRGDIFWSYFILVSWGMPPGVDQNQILQTVTLIQLVVFAIVFVLVGGKFLLFLRNSSAGSGTSVSDEKTKMLKRMALGLLASALAMAFQSYLLIIFTNSLFSINYTPLGGQKIQLIISICAAFLVSFTQILTFSSPILRKKRETAALQQSKASTASGASSSAASSSAATSSSSGATSSIDGSSTTASSH